MTQAQNLQTSAPLRQWRLVAGITLAFLLAVGVVMCVDYVHSRKADPFSSVELKELKDELRAAPANEELKNEIRALDLSLRERHFRHLSRMHSGAWLLVVVGAVFLVALARSRQKGQSFQYLRTRLASESDRRKAVTSTTFAVASATCALALFLGWATWGFSGVQLPRHAAQVDKFLGISADAAVPDCASPAEMEKNWPRFRGPGGNGVHLAGDAPASWDAASRSGVAWTVSSPLAGYNSPIVFNEHIYFSGGESGKLEVVCLRMADGQLVWRKAVEPPAGSAQGPEVPESTGYAPNTMATDGRRVYAIFANGVLGAFTMDGNPVWSKSFAPVHNPYGHAISLATFSDRLVVQLDQGESGEGKSVLYALDGRTGKPAWQKARTLGASWATPIIIESGSVRQIITLSVPFAIAYAASNGAELWRADCLNGEVTPSPVFAAGMLIIPSPSDRIMAFRPDGKGDVTKTHMLWSFDEDIPDVTSPVIADGRVYFVTTSGTLTCLSLETGKKLWSHEMNFECHASPAVSGKHLYVFGQDGSTVVVEAAAEYKEVFRNSLPDSFHASPAFVQGSIIVRGMTNIWRLASSPPMVAKGASKQQQ